MCVITGCSSWRQVKGTVSQLRQDSKENNERTFDPKGVQKVAQAHLTHHQQPDQLRKRREVSDAQRKWLPLTFIKSQWDFSSWFSLSLLKVSPFVLPLQTTDESKSFSFWEGQQPLQLRLTRKSRVSLLPWPVGFSPYLHGIDEPMGNSRAAAVSENRLITNMTPLTTAMWKLWGGFHCKIVDTYLFKCWYETWRAYLLLPVIHDVKYSILKLSYLVIKTIMHIYMISPKNYLLTYKYWSSRIYWLNKTSLKPL